MTGKKFDEEEEKWDLFETLLEMWDCDKLIDLVQKEYKRGFADGRADILAKVEGLFRDTPTKLLEKPKDDTKVVVEDVKVVEESRDAIGPQPITREEAREKWADSELVPDPQWPIEDYVEKQQPEKDVGGRPRTKVPRPLGLPTNFEMARVAIQEIGPADAPAIREFIRKRWWPSIPKEWTAVLWGFSGDGRLAKDGILFKLPEKKKAEPPPTPTTKRLVDAPASPNVLDQVEFKHGSQTIMLHPRENAIATRLRAAMGSGHLDAKFLAEAAAGRKVADHANWMSEMVSAMKPKMESVGLRIDFYRGYGYIMKEVAA